MNSRRRISDLHRFEGKPIAIRDSMEPVLMAVLEGPLLPRTPESACPTAETSARQPTRLRGRRSRSGLPESPVKSWPGEPRGRRPRKRFSVLAGPPELQRRGNASRSRCRGGRRRLLLAARPGLRWMSSQDLLLGWEAPCSTSRLGCEASRSPRVRGVPMEPGPR